jgi:hypothetical protein
MTTTDDTTFMDFLFYFALLFLGICVITFFGTMLMIGTGYLISSWFNFSLLEASLLCLGVAFVFTFILWVTFYISEQI